MCIRDRERRLAALEAEEAAERRAAETEVARWKAAVGALRSSKGAGGAEAGAAVGGTPPRRSQRSQRKAAAMRE
eukprot:4779671-Prymnesium_polylepis.1